MSPLLFAVVDAVLHHGLVSAESMAQWHHKYGPHEWYWRRKVELGEALLGWWRSCWPISR